MVEDLSQLATTPAQFREVRGRHCPADRRSGGGHPGARYYSPTNRTCNQALALIRHGARMDERTDIHGRWGQRRELTARAYAGLTIQIHQLKNIKETVGGWMSQIRMCMDGILRLSASEVVGIGPLVLEKEREVSSQLAQVEALESESAVSSERLRRTLGGLSNLMQLVTSICKGRNPCETAFSCWHSTLLWRRAAWALKRRLCWRSRKVSRESRRNGARLPTNPHRPCKSCCNCRSIPTR